MIKNNDNMLVFGWQPVLTDHQAFTYNSLAKIIGTDIQIFVTQIQNVIRQDQGWTNANYTNLKKTLLPNTFFIIRAFRKVWHTRENIHIFGSPFENIQWILLILVSSLICRNVYLITEPYSPVGLSLFNKKISYLDKVKGFLRPFVFQSLARLFKRRICGIFAISNLAINQYLKIGINRQKIFPFGYFVPRHGFRDQGFSNPSGSVNRKKILVAGIEPLKLIFIGALIPRKGLDVLINAVSSTYDNGLSVSLDIYGAGNVDSYIIDDRCMRYKGCIPFGEVQPIVSEYDFLVLPSYFDGWGVVVNEAILAGVPVICSDGVGAKVIVDSFNVGMVFPAGNVSSLSNIFTTIGNDLQRIGQFKKNCKLAYEAITPNRAAEYMFNVLFKNFDLNLHECSPWRFDNNSFARKFINNQKLRLHYTNISGQGIGAAELLQSLIPEISRQSAYLIEKVYLPSVGPLSTLGFENPNSQCVVYNRRVPNILSRFVECILPLPLFKGSSPLLVLGDLPLNVTSPQVVFVQTINIFFGKLSLFNFQDLKYFILKLVFKYNINKVNAVIVQSICMKSIVEKNFPELKGSVYIVPQPVPTWLQNSRPNRKCRIRPKFSKLSLFYPAALYPHKNHHLLLKIDRPEIWPVEELILTIDDLSNKYTRIPWIRSVGHLSPQHMVDIYCNVDCVLFLSKRESYGFPLLEAMYSGLPIICPSLDYARLLCGDEAIYFDPDDQSSLYRAVLDLKVRIDDGWWPNWSAHISNIPDSWEQVGLNMLKIAAESANYTVKISSNERDRK